MRNKDVVQDIVAPGGLRYARILTGGNINKEDLNELKKHYGYFHIYTLKKIDDPDLSTLEQKTIFINLDKGLDEVFSDFNDTCKKHIRRAERNPEIMIKILDDNFEGSYELYRNIKSAEGAKPDIETEFQDCLLFNAYYKGKMIVTMSFYDNGETIRAKHIASVRKLGEDQKVVAQASRLITWEVCKWGASNGRKLLDLAGITDDPKKAGIKAFKESFGGNEGVVYMQRYEMPAFSDIKKKLNLEGKNIN